MWRRSEWWNEEVKEVIRKKRVAFSEFLGNKNVEKWEEYRRSCREVKKGVKEAKRRAKESWSTRVEEYARVDSKKFWKEVNRVRKKKEEICGGIRNREGVVVRGAEKEVVVWSNYFQRLLNEPERG